MNSRYIAYLIASALHLKYRSGKKIHVSRKDVEEEISMIAGDDPRTLKKYIRLLENQKFLIAVDPESFNIPNAPKRPLTPKEYIDELKEITGQVV